MPVYQPVCFLMLPALVMTIDLDLIARYRFWLWFDWYGGLLRAQLRYRVRRNGTSRARRNAHRNERLTRVEGKMPMEPRFERELANG